MKCVILKKEMKNRNFNTSQLYYNLLKPQSTDHYEQNTFVATMWPTISMIIIVKRTALKQLFNLFHLVAIRHHVSMVLVGTFYIKKITNP